ncbi:hypothetical protein BBJ28_00009450 [Nothophytophthora sp. Chile5]|nr:hypothetical protein BBJ28_00009450 [Nothophytophthora sp. Chile5]
MFLCCAAGPAVKTFAATSEAITLQHTLNSLNADVTCVRYNHNGRILASSSVDGGISLDVTTGELLSRFFYPGETPANRIHRVTAIQASPHPYARHTLGSTYADGSVRVWDLSTGQLTAEFVRHHEAPATSLALSPVSKVLLATGGLDGRVIFFDIQQRKYVAGPSELRVLDLEQPVSSLALCADGKTLAVGTTTGEILVYDLRGVITPLYSTLVHETAAVHSLHFAPPAADAATSGTLPEALPVVSAERLPLCKGETLQEIALRKLETLGMNSPTGKRQIQFQEAAPPSPLSSPSQFATRPRKLHCLPSLYPPRATQL